MPKLPPPIKSKMFYEKETNLVRFVFEGLIPSKKNGTDRIARYIKGKVRVLQVPSKNYREWNQTILGDLMGFRATLRNRLGLKLPFETIQKIDVTFIYGTLGRNDNHNKFESIADTLVDAEIVTDDSYTNFLETSMRGRYEKNKPGAIIDLYL